VDDVVSDEWQCAVDDIGLEFRYVGGAVVGGRCMVVVYAQYEFFGISARVGDGVGADGFGFVSKCDDVFVV